MHAEAGPDAGRRALLRWVASVALAAPVLLLYLVHASQPNATGFLMYEMPYYMSCAREYHDAGFGPLYGNPFNPDPETARIYFQPLTFGLGLVWKLTGVSPGLLFSAFGLLATVVGMRLALEVYDELIGLEAIEQRLGLVCFAWGGGLAVLAALVIPGGAGEAASLRFDPGAGFWFLNFGRNFVFPTEALYHVLVLAAVLLHWRGKVRATLLVLAVLSLSHPMTGIQFLAIFTAWAYAERLLFKQQVPQAYLIALPALLVLHLGYYLVWLPSHAEHALVQQRLRLAWTVTGFEQLLGYSLVGGLALASSRRHAPLRAFLDCPRRRLLLVWLVTSLALINHELFMPPHQPVHFTRGHVWTALALLGAPALVALFAALVGSRRPLAYLAAAAVMGLLLFDNAAWFRFQIRARQGIYLSASASAVIAAIDGRVSSDTLVVCEDSLLSYMLTVYTPVRAWCSHEYLTPDAGARRAELARFFQGGPAPAAWVGRDLVVIESVSQPRVGGLPASGFELHRGPVYRVVYYAKG